MESSLLLLYASKKADIQKRLEELDKVKYDSNEKIFAELAFCLCTPQSRALSVDRALKTLQKDNLLLAGTAEQIGQVLESYGVRFHNNKAQFIVKAREQFSKDGQIKIKTMINTDDLWGLRNWLADNVQGLGYKEASHFLRNIGYGQDLAILDRHILKSLLKYQVISEFPLSLSKSKYLEIEQKMKVLAAQLHISMAELDMVFWSELGSLPIENLR